ncbi:hypothetical protein ABZ816_02640 [Actinosynnema sp. NPDC047251]|uniref:Uncharacterized protein n=1 Tax=Saccharothrix espanaensis (strain ATCC 51144 / DSM 44229 / JCM 9112 / NBRC 15066 / NRRL 15764) TaxID=1179773 RepID=K0JTP1_SACES|nr:hypothetical protein [Saccharothrix espanaensis]CCH31150.1 hypothetical protein BN6_38600 [Saccharothrix espanaensis DSM 44229]
MERGLTGCIGCGCLSLRRCRVLNPDDSLGVLVRIVGHEQVGASIN